MIKRLMTATLLLACGSLAAQPYDRYQDEQPYQSYDQEQPYQGYEQDQPYQSEEQQQSYQGYEQEPPRQTYRQEEILQHVESFFGQGAESLGQVVQKVFRDYGEPNAFIAGEEVAAALGVGLRYGQGTLNVAYGQERPVYWQGPSIGLDLGVNVAKVFVLIYHLPNEAALFQRFPGVEGSLYFVGGVGVNYLQSGNVVVAPIRLGAGWRQGLSAGYMDFTERQHYNPF